MNTAEVIQGCEFESDCCTEVILKVAWGRINSPRVRGDLGLRTRNYLQTGLGAEQIRSPKILQGIFFYFCLSTIFLIIFFLSRNSLFVLLFSVLGIFVTFYLTKKGKKHFSVLWLKIFNLARGEMLSYFLCFLGFNFLLPYIGYI